MAHLLELPKKIKLSAEDYLIVQQIYRGWSLLGVVFDLNVIAMRRWHANNFLGIHITCQSADQQLDVVTCQLDRTAQAMGVFTYNSCDIEFSG